MQFSLLALAAFAAVSVSAQQLLVYPQKRQNAGDSSLTLDSSLVQVGSTRNGQDDVVTDGQEASLTSQNNFINYCGDFPNVALTNGQQIFNGSCNGIPSGLIPAKNKMPAQIFKFPTDGAVLPANTDINFQVGVLNLDTGHFTNAQRAYYTAPTQLNAQGIIVGHTHITVQAISAIDSTDVQDIQKFAFFKGINGAAVNGVASALAAGGLAEGFYRACSLGTNANHAPPLMTVAQRASENDCVRFTVSAKAGNGAGAGAAAGGAGAGAAAGGAGAGAAAGGAGAGAAAGGAAAGAGGAAAGAGAGGAAASATSTAAAGTATKAAGGKKNQQGAGQAKNGQQRGGRNQKRTNFARPSFSRRNSTGGRARMARDEQA